MKIHIGMEAQIKLMDVYYIQIVSHPPPPTPVCKLISILKYLRAKQNRNQISVMARFSESFSLLHKQNPFQQFHLLFCISHFTSLSFGTYAFNIFT
jgi:hypothetical protein